MKKLFIAAIAVFTFGTINAQEDVAGFSKGNVFVTGSVGFSSTSYDGDSQSNFNIMPQLGYFVSENIAIGGRLGFMSSSVKVEGSDSVSLSGWNVGAFGRYYFTPANQFSLFGEFGVDYASQQTGQLTADNKDININAFGAGLGLGLNYFVSKNFSIEATAGVLGFGSAKTDVDGAKATNVFQFGGDWSAVSFGVNYKF
jgi:outer membrane protein